VTCQISRNGDLIHKVYLQATLPAQTASGAAWAPYAGLRLLKEVEIEIGGQRIKHVGAQKHLTVANECKATENIIGGAHSRFYDCRIAMGMPQMLVS
jgi:hypothetical protein